MKELVSYRCGSPFGPKSVISRFVFSNLDKFVAHKGRLKDLQLDANIAIYITPGRHFVQVRRAKKKSRVQPDSEGRLRARPLDSPNFKRVGGVGGWARLEGPTAHYVLRNDPTGGEPCQKLGR